MRFDLPEPEPNFLFSHAGRDSLAIYSKAQYAAEGIEGYEAAPAGSSPFEYEGREVGQSILFSAIDDHWPGATPDYDEIEFRWVSEPSTRLAMLSAGEAHAVTLPRDLQEDASDAGHTVIASSEGAMQTTMLFTGQFMNPNAEENRDARSYAWADVRVREAMNRALDRDVILEALYGEGVRTLPVYTMDPRFPGYSEELATRFDDEYGYDPERAQELLAEAGYPDSFEHPEIPLVVTSLAGNPEFAQMAELVQAYFDLVGIETEMREQDWATGNTAIRGFTADFVTPMRNAPVRPSALGSQIFFTTHASPHLDVGDPELNDLGAALIQETNPAIRGETFTRIFDTYAHLPMVTVPAAVVVNSNLVDDATQDQIDTFIRDSGLDQPLWKQYVTFLGNAVQGDFGTSMKWPGESAMGFVLDRMPATLQLGGLAIFISVVIVLPLGIAAAVRKGSATDNAAQLFALLGQSMPNFWLGIVLVWVFSVGLGWLPTSGMGSFVHLILSAIAIAWFQISALTRLMRSAMARRNAQFNMTQDP